ncbi:MAG: PIN domain-containing protein [Atopobiaceae bacterium]|nr:PIN domain-containing protein [Atopobiaceae bacterium]
MSRILLDTNAAIDLVFPREQERREAMIAILCELSEERDELLLPSLCLKDVSYVLENSAAAKRRWAERADRMALSSRARSYLLAHCTIVAVDDLVCRRAHRNHTEPDFNDALVAECAVIAHADVILSSDRRAFNASLVPKMSPQEFARHLAVRD